MFRLEEKTSAYSNGNMIKIQMPTMMKRKKGMKSTLEMTHRARKLMRMMKMMKEDSMNLLRMTLKRQISVDVLIHGEVKLMPVFLTNTRSKTKQ